MTDEPQKKPPQDLLEWLGLASAPNWAAARPLGRIFGFLVVVIFFAAIAAAVSVLYGTIRDVFWSDNTSGPNLGAGALVTALLGGPFLIWSTLIKHQSLRYQKEGHMTDRIAKAVEMLGAEKKESHPARSVTYLKNGKVTRVAIEYLNHTPQKELKKRSGEEIQYGDWRVFDETVSNLEVRIGAILSLERIAQDSTTHDKGRDHVRVMEILCAYIRENAKAEDAQDHPYGDWKPLNDDPTDKEREEHLKKREERFGNYGDSSVVRDWAQALPPPREDIALALKAIGRRTHQQLLIEAVWPDHPNNSSKRALDTPCPALSGGFDNKSVSSDTLISYELSLKAWKDHVRRFPNYRLDLSNTNLQRANLAGGQFEAAQFENARMEGAIIKWAKISGAVFTHARLDGANLSSTRLQGANLKWVMMEGALLVRARLNGADFSFSRIHGSNLKQSHLEGSNFRWAGMEAVDLIRARLDLANLFHAQIDGTNLSNALIERANLCWARMDSHTLLMTCSLKGTALSGPRLEIVSLAPEQLDACFGDASVKLPTSSIRPSRWPVWILPDDSKDNSPTYESELANWRRKPDEYTPPLPPASPPQTA